MKISLYNLKMVVFLSVLALSGCDDNERPNLRPKIEYSALTPETPYSSLFVDKNGTTTVDLTEGNQRHKMFQALNYYSTSSVSASAQIDAAKLKNMFSNTGSPFTDIITTTINVSGSELNASSVQLKNVVASSRPATEAAAVAVKIESYFD